MDGSDLWWHEYVSLHFSCFFGGGGGGKKQPHAACEEGTLAGATCVPMHTKMFRAVSQDTWLRHHLLPTSKKPDFKHNSDRTENRVKFFIEE